MKVRRETLLLLASVVWLIAGFSVCRIGVMVYSHYLDAIDIALTVAVFAVFYFMIFGKLVRKHTARILGYSEEQQFFLKFFDRKAFIIMAVMMSGGMILRTSGIAPEHFIAVFYTGLGAALFLAGVGFGVAYSKNVCPAMRCSSSN